ncbi:hypothetical protein GCK72_010461 [Caenorhabditis remanei]|uniref:Tyrosine-protein phosphatase domain-containing protein n=1 Tax=Caenorhabditis remanei TaxID=31234 RepID=A0A6A5H5A3_CAERE|nr:hypothetical protein GCK72_010461 [Caenorhabditis remanei]KAF1762199.1 hypothetical protein GCK72_010461 [Caenorhabditis remanei]
MTNRPSKSNTKNSTRGKQNNDETSKHPKKSKHPRKVREVKQEQEQSSAMSIKAVKKGKKVSNAQQSVDGLGGGVTKPVHAKKEKNLTISDDEAPTAGTATSTLSTVSTAGSSDVPPQTPPRKELGSIRKTKGNHGNDHIPSSIKHHATTPTTQDKWVGEAAARSWIEKADFEKAKADYAKIQSIGVNVEKECKIWKSNSKWNQSEEYPTLDSNLVKVDNEYVNMAQLDTPFGKNVFLGQFPVKNSEEAFWKAVFDKRATNIHIIVGNESFDFFPQKAEDYRNYGNMWINNRKVTQIHGNDDVCRYHIEVLPRDCSNSIVCVLDVIKNWNFENVPVKYAVAIKQTIELTNFFSNASSDESALIMSQHGAGRAGFLLALTVAVNKLDSKTEPCIADIVKSIRVQRPKAVESLTQYAGLYTSLFYFIKKKLGKSDGLVKKSAELTQQFTNALNAEINQPSVIGSVASTVTNTNNGSAVMSLAISGQK